MTLMELMVVLTILTVALSLFSRTLVLSSRLDPVNRETVLAAEGARSMLETIRNSRFGEIARSFNEEAADDPDGAGTAQGRRFVVANLAPVAGEQLVGTVIMPFNEEGELREDAVNEMLGMPRDLNGDGVIDSDDHIDDAIVLPIGVRLEWHGATGDRSLEMYTLFADL
jgi:type II secretory pathway pseudopilin PulG